ncbi:MAG: aryl-sulfate sulfotransferase, partial [Chloroflexota bacterium]|nr:aryl-sulfate sulfotransferase [Chloroflexota bacterium]
MGRSVHHPVGLIYTSSESYGGYTLFTTNGGDHATLLDVDGNVVHRWHSDEGIVYAYLIPNGNLLCRTRPPTDVEVVHNLGGSSSALIELDWDGNVVWRYDDPMLHHDFARMENGNTLALLFKELDEETTQKVKGGHTSDEDPSRILGDIIREVSPGGDTVSEWDISETLSFDEDVICPLEHRREWTHANCLNLTPEGDFLISFRNTSTVGILSRDTGKFLWK